MPQLLSAGSIIETRIVGYHDAQTIMTVLHWATAFITPGDADFVVYAPELNTALSGAGALYDKYLEAMSEEYHGSKIQHQLIGPVGRFAFQEFSFVGEDGLVAEPALPPNDGAMLVKRNDNTGRRNRGGVHMPCVPVPWNEEGFLSPAAVAAYNALGAEIVRPVNVTVGGGAQVRFNPVIFNRADMGSSPNALYCTPKPELRTNRRRTVGRGI